MWLFDYNKHNASDFFLRLPTIIMLHNFFMKHNSNHTQVFTNFYFSKTIAKIKKPEFAKIAAISIAIYIYVIIGGWM